jgi:hypothetical protein
VPAPIMIIGTCGFSGGRNGIDGGRTKTKAVPATGTCARWLEQTPLKVPLPERAGALSTPAVMLQLSGLTRGEEEIE